MSVIPTLEMKSRRLEVNLHSEILMDKEKRQRRRRRRNEAHKVSVPSSQGTPFLSAECSCFESGLDVFSVQ